MNLLWYKIKSYFKSLWCFLRRHHNLVSIHRIGTIGNMCTSCGIEKIDLLVIIEKHPGVKCPRCRHFHPFVDNFDNLCDRCCKVLLELIGPIQGFDLDMAQTGIKEAYKIQSEKYTIKEYLI